jgi:hypothetical protein
VIAVVVLAAPTVCVTGPDVLVA